jgi:hypothetical protein
MIVIPTYQRYHIKTIDLLIREGISDYTIYVANQDEYDKYDYPNKVIGVKGIRAQREFIQSQYAEGTILLSMDDDIEDFTHSRNLTMKKWIDECTTKLQASTCGLMSFNPSSNPFFTKTWDFKEGRYLCCGMVHMFKVNHSIKGDIDFVEDYDRGLQYLEKDGAILRCGDICFKTKCFSKGGLEEERTRDAYLKNVNKLVYKYPFLKHNIKKSGIMKGLPNIKLAKPNGSNVIQLPKYDMTTIYELCKPIIFRKRLIKNNRLGFPIFRASIFGIIRGRFNGIIGLSLDSKKFPELYEELKRIGDIFCPFPCSKIQLNHNLRCPPHKDSKNQSKSLLISFGEYTGGEIVIDGVVFNAFHTPTIFNGAEYEHYNNPHVGDKYSIIFFN